MVQAIENLTDRQIVEKVLLGDRQSYAALIHKYKNLVYRIAWNSVGNQETTEDIVQDAFTNAFQNLERLKNPDAFGSWICSITQNMCKTMHRKNKNNPIPLDDLVSAGNEPYSNNTQSHSDKEMSTLLSKTIKKLPEKYQEIIDLRYTEEFSCKKIASFLALTERAVISRLYNARKMILNILKKEGVL